MSFEVYRCAVAGLVASCQLCYLSAIGAVPCDAFSGLLTSSCTRPDLLISVWDRKASHFRDRKASHLSVPHCGLGLALLCPGDITEGRFPDAHFKSALISWPC